MPVQKYLVSWPLVFSGSGTKGPKVFGFLGFGIPWIGNKRAQSIWSGAKGPMFFWISSIYILSTLLFQPLLNISKLMLNMGWCNSGIGSFEVCNLLLNPWFRNSALSLAGSLLWGALAMFKIEELNMMKERLVESVGG